MVHFPWLCNFLNLANSWSISGGIHGTSDPEPDDAPGHRGDSSTLCALHARRYPQSLGWCSNILEERLGVCLKVRYPIPKVYRQYCL